MQNKLHKIQFSHHLMTDSQSIPEQWFQNPELTHFANFAKLLEQFELPDKRGFKPTETRKIPAPWTKPYS